MAEKNQINASEASARLDGLLATLPLVNQVELVQKPISGQLHFTLRVRFVEPLGK